MSMKQLVFYALFVAFIVFAIAVRRFLRDNARTETESRRTANTEDHTEREGGWGPGERGRSRTAKIDAAASAARLKLTEFLADIADNAAQEKDRPGPPPDPERIQPAAPRPAPSLPPGGDPAESISRPAVVKPKQPRSFTTRAAHLRRQLDTSRSLRQAMVLKEVLDKPLALRGPGGR